MDGPFPTKLDQAPDDCPECGWELVYNAAKRMVLCGWCGYLAFIRPPKPIPGMRVCKEWTIDGPGDPRRN